MQWKKDDYRVSDDKALLDIEFVYQFISNSYWAKGIPKETMTQGLDNSLCFMLFENEQPIGFARVVSDYATFGYLADVFVIDSYQGRGLGKWLMACVMSHPQLQGLRRFMLATLDAHGVYEPFGFEAINKPEMLMQVHRPDIYK